MQHRPRKLKGIVLTLTIGAALAASLAAASTARSETTARSDTVTLNLIMSAGGNKFGWDLLIKNFNNVYPSIQVNPTYLPTNQLSTVILTQFNSGNPPDLFRSPPGNSSAEGIWPMASANKLLDLTGSPWVKRVPKSMKLWDSFNKRVYGLPLSYSVFGVIYNTAVFSQLGLKVPTTFAQMLTMCRKVAAAGKIPIDLAGAQGTQGLASIIFNRLVNEVYNVDPNWTTKRVKGQVTAAASPLWHRFFQSIVDMKEANCFENFPQATTITQGYTAVARGEALGYIGGGVETQGMLAINPDAKLGMFNLPGSDAAKATIAINYAGQNLAIAKATQHPKEAQTFVNFVARPKQAALYARVTAGVTPYDAARGIVPPLMAPLAPLFKAGRVMLSPTVSWPNPSLTDQISADIVGLFTGQKTVDQALADVDAKWSP